MIRTVLTAPFIAHPVHAQGLPLEVQPVTEDVWAIVGETGQRRPENLANNAVFGLVVTDEGAVLIGPGGPWKGAEALHDAIRTVTDQPLVYVINSGGQGHRWLGNSYWQAQGATAIASVAADADHHAHASDHMSASAQFLGDGLKGTAPSHADVSFESDHTLDVGGVSFEIVYRRPAHTPRDSFVGLDESDVVFTGYIAYVERILGNGPARNDKSRIQVFDAMATFDPTHIVPGHGPATDMSTARRDTYDYFVNLRTQIGALIEEGGDIMDAPSIDPSAWANLERFDCLMGRNAPATYEEMEWE